VKPIGEKTETKTKVKMRGERRTIKNKHKRGKDNKKIATQKM
jgi:hypothetical protein